MLFYFLDKVNLSNNFRPTELIEDAKLKYVTVNFRSVVFIDVANSKIIPCVEAESA